MSPLGKLFAAALIIATGLGVATLLGKPSVLTHAFDSARTSAPPTMTTAPPSAPATAAWDAHSVQLLPETTPTIQPALSASAVERPALEMSVALTPVSPVSSAQQTGGAQQINKPATESGGAAPTNNIAYAPQARLRNEAPRPMGIEPRSPATIRRMPAVTENSGSVATTDPYAVTTTLQAPSLVPVNFSSDDTSTTSTAMSTASYNEPYRSAADPSVSPPPWPAENGDAGDGQRTHLVADGDSLEKLAGRYLGDPHRSAEIFELNRDLLSSPDLLPIDAELKIPPRSARTSWDRQGRRTTSPNDRNVREAAAGNLVPVRALPATYEGVNPRAQLARPVPVE